MGRSTISIYFCGAFPQQTELLHGRNALKRIARGGTFPVSSWNLQGVHGPWSHFMVLPWRKKTWMIYGLLLNKNNNNHNTIVPTWMNNNDNNILNNHNNNPTWVNHNNNLQVFQKCGSLRLDSSGPTGSIRREIPDKALLPQPRSICRPTGRRSCEYGVMQGYPHPKKRNGMRNQWDFVEMLIFKQGNKWWNMMNNCVCVSSLTHLLVLFN